MDIKGYCLLKSVDTVRGYRGDKNDLLGAPLTIIDVAVGNSGFLVLNRKHTAIADVRMSDVNLYFFCDIVCGVVLPPNLPYEKKMVEVAKRLSRKGGYNKAIRCMVIGASIVKGEFNDDFLFEQQ